MALKSKEFGNLRDCARHFGKHKRHFLVADPIEYEGLADRFLAGLKRIGVQECVRTKGDVLRYDPSTEEFGILDKTGFIRSYFKPVPCHTVPAAKRKSYAIRGLCHSERTNLDGNNVLD